MNNIVETAPYEEHDDKTEALLERECLFRELEVARTEMSTPWLVHRSHGARSLFRQPAQRDSRAD